MPTRCTSKNSGSVRSLKLFISLPVANFICSQSLPFFPQFFLICNPNAFLNAFTPAGVSVISDLLNIIKGSVILERVAPVRCAIVCVVLTKSIPVLTLEFNCICAEGSPTTDFLRERKPSRISITSSSENLPLSNNSSLIGFI